MRARMIAVKDIQDAIDNCVCQHFPGQPRPPACVRCLGMYNLLAEAERKSINYDDYPSMEE